MNPKTFNSSTRLLAFGVLAIFVMSFASAAVLTLTNTTVLPTEIKAGESVTIGLELTYVGTTTDRDFSWSGTPADYWTLPSQTVIQPGESISTTATITAPSNEVGSRNAEIKTFFGASSSSLTFAFEIPSEPSLSLPSSTFMDFSETTSTILLTNNGNVPLTNIALTASGDFEVTFNNTGFTLNPGASMPVLVTKTTLISSLKMGINTVTITATSGGTSSTGTVKFEKSFCEIGPQNDTALEFDVKISNKGDGTDSEWKPLDTIEVEVDIDNKGTLDVQDVIFELGLFKKGSSQNIADDLIWLSDEDESYKFGDIDEDEDGNHVFEFRVNPDKFDDGDYVLVIKAYSDDDEDKVCVDYSSDLADSEFGSSSKSFAEIKIDKENDKGKMVVVDTYPLFGMIAQCGQSVSFFADVYNIGDEDFEDQVKVNLFNKELGISLNDIILGDFDAGDKGRANFIFTVPQNASDKVYFLSMSTEYDYDKKKDKYDEVSEEAFRVQLNVQGCSASGSDVLVSASLGSDAVSGDEMSINVVLTNTKNNLRVFTIEATGYQTWADLLESPSTLTVGPQSAGEATLRFNVKDDISGEQPFTLRIFENGNLIATQSVSVNIEPKSSFGFTGFAIGGDNAYLWGMGLLNIILLVVIIVVAVRFARK